jgi:hypothetical protein
MYVLEGVWRARGIKVNVWQPLACIAHNLQLKICLRFAGTAALDKELSHIVCAVYCGCC